MENVDKSQPSGRFEVTERPDLERAWISIPEGNWFYHSQVVILSSIFFNPDF